MKRGSGTGASWPEMLFLDQQVCCQCLDALGEERHRVGVVEDWHPVQSFLATGELLLGFISGN